MSMSQDLEDEVINLCNDLKITPLIGMNKYNEIYEHLKPLDQYKTNEHKLISDSVHRTKTWLRAHYENKICKGEKNE